jgi:hypothetical protein
LLYFNSPTRFTLCNVSLVSLTYGTFHKKEIDAVQYLDSTEFRTSTEAELRTSEHRGELESEVSEARFEDDLIKQK